MMAGAHNEFSLALPCQHVPDYFKQPPLPFSMHFLSVGTQCFFLLVLHVSLSLSANMFSLWKTANPKIYVVRDWPSLVEHRRGFQ
jgi:hypothetical protein